METKTLFSVADISQLREHYRQSDNPMAWLAAFTSLHIKKGFTLRAYPYRVRLGGVGNVWAVPESSADTPDAEECGTVDLFEAPRPFPIKYSCLEGLAVGGSGKLIRPPDALDNIMEAIEGDGTPWSYLSASIFARDIAEFGASWHGGVWSTHKILEEAPWTSPHAWGELFEPNTEQEYWHWSATRPSEWRPSVVSNGEVVTVKFYTCSKLVREAIYCYIDTYEPDNYRFEWDVKTIAEGQNGFVF